MDRSSLPFRWSLAVITAFIVFYLHSSYLILSGVISVALISTAGFISAAWGGWSGGFLCLALIAVMTRFGLTHGELPLERFTTDLLWAIGLSVGAVTAGESLRKALQYSEDEELRYAELLNGMKGSVLVWTVNARDLKVTEINNIRYLSDSSKVLGHPIDRWLMGRDFWIRIIHPEDREKTLKALKAAALKPGIPSTVEHRLIGADRNPIWFQSTAQARIDDPTHLHLISIDIRDSKRWEESYGDQLAQTQAFEASLIHGALTVDLEGRIRSANPGARQFFAIEESKPETSDWLFAENGQLISAVRSGVPHEERFRPEWLIRTQPLRHLDGSLTGAVISFHSVPLRVPEMIEERQAS